MLEISFRGFLAIVSAFFVNDLPRGLPSVYEARFFHSSLQASSRSPVVASLPWMISGRALRIILFVLAAMPVPFVRAILAYDPPTYHRFPYQLTDDNSQMPASAASSGEVKTQGSHDLGRGGFP